MFGWGDPGDTANMEPEIRAACEAINNSGWVWTSESCQGHADGSPGGPWKFPMPFMRLVTRNEDCGRLLRALAEARPKEPFVQIHVGLPSCPNADWVDVPVYAGIPGEEVDPATLADRRLLFTRLADILPR